MPAQKFLKQKINKQDHGNDKDRPEKKPDEFIIPCSHVSMKLIYFEPMAW
jgi:hypothetical protein